MRPKPSKNRRKSHFTSYLDAIGKFAADAQKNILWLIPHSGEKGRLIEKVTRNLLLKFLPKRFSLGTGFVVTADGATSSQFDIVIYDNIYNSVMFSDYGVGLFPIESVYATIEVKTKLTKENLQKTLHGVANLRNMKRKKEYINYVFNFSKDEGDEGVYRKSKTDRQILPIPLSPRNYVFAFDCWTNNFNKLEGALREELIAGPTFLHGLFIMKKGWFLRQKTNKHKSDSVRLIREHGLRDFYIALVSALDSFPMYPANLKAYVKRENADES